MCMARSTNFDMTSQTLKLDEIQYKTIEELLQAVLHEQQTLNIQFPDGEEVVIQPKPHLQPLPTLEGCVPEGWKKAIYDES